MRTIYRLCGSRSGCREFISLCIFALVSAAAFLYLILTPPKNEKIIKLIGFAGLAFDIILVPVYAVMRLITGG